MFRKVLAVALVAMFICSSAFSATDILKSDGSTVSIPVATTATVYTRSFGIDNGSIQL